MKPIKLAEELNESVKNISESVNNINKYKSVDVSQVALLASEIVRSTLIAIALKQYAQSVLSYLSNDYKEIKRLPIGKPHLNA